MTLESPGDIWGVGQANHQFRKFYYVKTNKASNIFFFTLVLYAAPKLKEKGGFKYKHKKMRRAGHTGKF